MEGEKNLFNLPTVNWNLASSSIMILGNNYNNINIHVALSPTEITISY